MDRFAHSQFNAHAQLLPPAPQHKHGYAVGYQPQAEEHIAALHGVGGEGGLRGGAGRGGDVLSPHFKPPPVFHTSAQLTLSASSSPSKDSPARALFQHSPPAEARHPAPAAAAGEEQARALSKANAQLLGRIAQLEEQLATRQQAQAAERSPAPPADEDAVRELSAKLASKQREVEALHKALDQHVHQLKQRQAELEQQQGREGALLDELASWKDAACKAEKQHSTLHRKLESATSHGGLLDSTLAAHKKQNAELSAAAGQAEAQLRQAQEEVQAVRRESMALRQKLAEAGAERQQLADAMLTAQHEAAQLRGRCQQLEGAAAAALPAPASDAVSSPAYTRSASLQGRQAGSAAGRALPSGRYSGPPTQQEEAVQAGSGAEQSRAYAPESAEGPSPPPSLPRTSSTRAYEPATEPSPPPSYRHTNGGQLGWEGWPAAAANGGSEWGHHPAHSPYSVRASMQVPQPYQQQLPSEPASFPATYAVRPFWEQPQAQHADPYAQPYLARADGYHSTEAEAAGQWEAQAAYCMHNGTAGYAPAGYVQPPTAQQQAPPHLPASPYSQAPSRTATTASQEISSQLSGLTIQSQPPPSSPFGTDDTVQEMLARTQALEARVTELTAEKNELAAEYARMPTHTAGKTLQASQWWWERKRRVEVERRQEEIQKEISFLRLQLKRLGAK